MINPEKKEKLKKVIRDPKLYIQNFLKIRTKIGQLVKFKFNPAQKKLYAEVMRQRDAGRPVRIIILKARQMGFSTLTEGLIFHKTATHKLTNSMIIAHKEEASTNLFNMSKLFYEELPKELRPMKKASNAKELIFENPTSDIEEKMLNPGLRSKIKIESARNTDAGRSETIHSLHCSEVAFWDRAEETMLSAMQSVPKENNTMVIIESTANGVGGYFYNTWQQATRGENDFVPLFFAWFEHPEYRMPAPADLLLSPEEEELSRLYNLDREQIVWRRWCIANNCGGDENLFYQEYPAYPEEAFLTSGRPVFNTKVLAQLLNDCPDPEFVGNVVEENGRVKFTEQPKGYLKIWKPPEEGRNYLISADVAEGLEHGDYSIADVIDRKTLEQVAQWHGHIDPDLFGVELARLARLYNRALVAPEVNNHGLTTITSLKKVYGHIYRRRTVDKITNKAKEEHGWQTNLKTKPLAIDKAVQIVRERLAKINCKETIEEMLTYVKDAKGATNAQEGCYDDRVMAWSIGQQVAAEIPYSDMSFEELELQPHFGRTGY